MLTSGQPQQAAPALPPAAPGHHPIGLGPWGHEPSTNVKLPKREWRMRCCRHAQMLTGGPGGFACRTAPGVRQQPCHVASHSQAKSVLHAELGLRWILAFQLLQAYSQLARQCDAVLLPAEPKPHPPHPSMYGYEKDPALVQRRQELAKQVGMSTRV
jgi:hypothetical protein